MASTSNTANENVKGYLKKIIGSRVGELFPLTSDEIIIGRNRMSAQIPIQDPNVSRNHCLLKYSEKGWLVKDLKSVNGTFLDGKQLSPEVFHPLKDGAGIYLGPPGEAPVAFIFFNKMPSEQCHVVNRNKCSQKDRGRTVDEGTSESNNFGTKRRSDPETLTTERLSQRKKFATLPSSPTPSSRDRDFLEDMENDENMSDCSICSSDSLRTRVRKLSAKKTSIKNSRNKGIINAATSTSASPQLRASNNANLRSKPSTSASSQLKLCDLECKPSTSVAQVEKFDKKKNKAAKPAVSKEFALLSSIFNESDSSTPETLKGEDSQSLLNDSKALIDCEPYPFSQALPSESEQNEQKKKAESEKEDLLDVQLQEATAEINKLKKDKARLTRLVQDLKSEEFFKRKVQVEFQKMLEDELMCNICTEVFIKAVTLGCSHTFCEYCISEWKKKQKKCPICREKIATESRILVLDSFISKAMEQLDEETQNRRKEIVSNREKSKVTQQKKRNKRSRGRSRQVRSSSSEADEIRQIRGESSNGIGVQIRFTGNNSPSVQLLPIDDILDLTANPSDELSELSVDSDVSVGGYGFFGGYGRCYNCGRRGHWANGCPYV